jgi:membrane protease YdiL (CAAX protease family)
MEEGTMYQGLMKPSLLAYAFLISLSGSAIGLYVFPALFAAGTGTLSASPPSLLAALAALAALAVLVLVLCALFFHAARRVLAADGRGGFPERGTPRTVAGLAVLFAAFAACALVLSLLYGLVAVLVYGLSGGVPLDEAKGAISFVASVLTLLLLPVFVQAFFAYGLNGPTAWAGVRNGLRALKAIYPRLLLLSAALFAAGHLLLPLFGRLPQGLPAEAAKAAATSVVGMFGLVFALAVFAREK